MEFWSTPRLRFIAALGGATVVSFGLFAYGAWRNGSLEYDFLLWNLFLAWLPLMFALWLQRTLKAKLWSSWGAIGISLLWLGFLPNSFYLISDLIHLQDVATVDILYDVIMFASFIYLGIVLGMASLYIVQRELQKRLSVGGVRWCVGLILLLCSIAIYLGRDLRWNTWDVVLKPSGLLFDISDRVLHPQMYGEMFITVIAFFVLLGSMYVVAWWGGEALRSRRA